jgi:hypothetical protein
LAHGLGGTGKILDEVGGERLIGGATGDRSVAPEVVIPAKREKPPRQILISAENVVTTFSNGL